MYDAVTCTMTWAACGDSLMKLVMQTVHETWHGMGHSPALLLVVAQTHEGAALAVTGNKVRRNEIIARDQTYRQTDTHTHTDTCTH